MKLPKKLYAVQTSVGAFSLYKTKKQAEKHGDVLDAFEKYHYGGYVFYSVIIPQRGPFEIMVYPLTFKYGQAIK